MDLLVKELNIKEFDVWSEGYQASGDSSRATYHGISEGRDFKDACINLAEFDRNFSKYFDPERITFWGCRLFDNEADARDSFG